MIKFLGLVIMLGLLFWVGYYVGQQPPGEVQEKLQNFSEEMAESALGIEKGKLDLHQEYLDAKSRIIESKSELLDRNYNEAAAQLEAALRHLKKALKMDPNQPLADELIAKIQGLKSSITSGEAVDRKELDDTQKDLDRLIEE